MRKKNDTTAIASDEADFASVLGIIATHRSRALMSVNVESLLTYWEIGAFLSPRIHSGSWSTAVVGKLADYIKRSQPELRGYGKSNLYNMARVYDVFSGERFGALLRKYESRIPEIGNFFQPVDGKSLVVLDVAPVESPDGRAVQARPHAEGSAEKDVRGISRAAGTETHQKKLR